MSQHIRFCPWCGASLVEGQRFCGQCGKAIPTVDGASNEAAPAPDQVSTPPPTRAPAPPQPAPPQPAPPPAQDRTPDEPIMGIIPGVQSHSGFLGLKVESYNLILTPRRMIFAFVSKQMMQQAVNEARLEAKAQGKGLLKQMAAQMSWLQNMSRKYETMPPQTILTQYPGSFDVQNGAVHKIRLRQSTDEDSGQTTRTMIIEALGKKRKFSLTAMGTRDAKRLLQQTLGGIVR